MGFAGGVPACDRVGGADDDGIDLYEIRRQAGAVREAIVGTAAEGMRKMFLATQEEFDGYEPAVKEEMVYSYSSGAIDTLVDYLYEHFEEFKLIVCCSAGNKIRALYR